VGHTTETWADIRNVAAAKTEDVDAAMESIRDRGFINFFGMQRFGTSTVPTHVTGLFLLQQKWAEAIDSILSLREGEHPDCTRARLAWLEDKDVTKALEYMPRRSVAERAIWEHWQKGNRIEDRLGALGTVSTSNKTHLTFPDPPQPQDHVCPRIPELHLEPRCFRADQAVQNVSTCWRSGVC
jgi:TruD family tRNA pseudouridine synthase